MQSPFFKLFGTSPNYGKLRVFGCLCYPWLKPYTAHKLEPKSVPCVFLGCSPSQSAVYCFDPSTHKMYISRHVDFVESVFPYNSLDLMLDRPSSQSHSVWDTLPSTVPHFSVPVSSPGSLPVHSSNLSSSSSVDTSIELSSSSSPVVHDRLLSPSLDVGSPDVSSLPTSISILPAATSSVSTDAGPRPRSPIVTRSKHNITKPNPKFFVAHTMPDLSFTEPTTSAQALKHPQWHAAMDDEFNALVRNGTWTLVPPEPSQNIVGCKWVFKLKRKSDGSIDRYKAR